VKEKVRELRRQLTHGDPGILSALVISVCIALLTFPPVVPVFSNGIDPPLAWIYNYLIQGRLLLGKDIIFPHGPLAFIMYPLPTGNNLAIAVALHLVLRSGFAYLLLRSRVSHGFKRMVAAIVLAIILLMVLDILLVIIGLVIIGYLNYLLSRRYRWLVISTLLTIMALFVKAFVGIICVTISSAFFLVLLYEVVVERRDYRPFFFLPIIPVGVIVVWFTLYGTFAGIGRYFFGMMQLAGDNSAAVAYYPDNNWLLLSLAFVLTIALVLLHFSEKKAFQFMILVTPALFSVWKYGMAREDYLHAGMFFFFVGMTILLFLMLIEKHRIVSVIMGSAIVILLYLNLTNAYYFERPRVNYDGIRNAYHTFVHFKTLSDTSITASEKNISRNRIDQQIREAIGESSVDIYPWDYSFIPANGFNWKPRPVIQSYACYTPWLDRQNARHFLSDQAPDYLLWELRKITHDIHGGTMESIDGRYLLNDQPETAISLIRNYELTGKQGGTFPVLVFRKRSHPLDMGSMILNDDIFEWNRWYDVVAPKRGDLLRINATFERNFLGDVKSFLYKDEACYIYYKLTSGEIRIYRLVPKNAASGIWVNPLIMNPEHSKGEPLVEKIMFRCSDPALMKPQIPITWESFRFADGDIPEHSGESDATVITGFFGKQPPVDFKYYIRAENDLEKQYEGWSENLAPEKGKSFSGTTSAEVGKGAFSISFEMPLDTLKKISTDTAWIIRTDAWVKASKGPDANFVISIEETGKPVIWKAVKIKDFILDKNEWNYVTNFQTLSRKELENRVLKLKVYAWNLGEGEFLIDDMRVMISGY